MNSRDLQKRDVSTRKVSRFTTNQSIFEWKGYRWQCCMEGGRLIHPEYPYQWYDADQVHKVNNDFIALSLQKKPTQIKYWDGNFYDSTYACGLMRSVDQFSYGTFTAEIVLPKGINLWPSFWLCGVGTWPDNGEIDVCEGYSEDNSYLRIFTSYFPWINPSWLSTNNIHYLSDNEPAEIGSRCVSIFKQKFDPSDNIIKYECEWLPDKITIKVNGVTVREDTTSAIAIANNAGRSNRGKKMHEPLMRVIFNLWCDGDNNNEVKDETDMLIKSFTYKPLKK